MSNNNSNNSRHSSLPKIYLARHGQDLDNTNGILNGHRDQPLTDLGKEQARTVAQKIQQHGLTFDVIYSSPLQRAKHTANIIAEAVGKEIDSKVQEVQVLPDLIERDFGVMTGVPTKKIKERCSPDTIFQTETISYFLSPPGAETFPMLMQRAARLLAWLRQKKYPAHDDTTILLVTHGDFGKMLYAEYYQLEWQNVLRQFHFGNSELLLLSQESSPDQAHVFTIQQYNS